MKLYVLVNFNRDWTRSERRKLGDYVMFMCLVDSRTKQIRWKKNYVYIDYSKNPRFREISMLKKIDLSWKIICFVWKLLSQDRYLRIEKLRMEDAGKYQCEAEDKNGCYRYREGELTVINLKPYNKVCGISIYDEQLLAIPKISHDKERMHFQKRILGT